MASKVTFNSAKIEGLLKNAAAKSLDLVAIAFQKRIRQMLSKAGSGTKYSGSDYKSSDDGEPPTVQTGNLRNSWVASSRKKVFGRRKVKVLINQGVSFGEAAKYAYWLEYGTRNMLPRPFVLPTVHRMRRVAPRVFMKRYKNLVLKIDAGGPYG